ncbi:L-histidine N(alpha)-methyltransferase [Wenzhouxiangella marina]|uniref:Methyltransferase n=1 Tax=Wenzhouxiangella marina TaxID=1579979 RepID=A0A0K0XXK4_9GAMM|nr:L-histidine N(alpha)-methyltransferase [Wenzhouxiangella marina]AKS42341.1 Methyltransferase [Wenzhouxiangella marina]MBB6085886.1 dimethylhistidine N-methyltransferase [Wenzhouxiangella marina]
MTARERFLADVLDGLSSRPRTLPCKYLYDARGSELFEAICETDDYYVTRADLALHEAHLGRISELIGPEAHIIEFGSGAGIKTRKLLAGLERPRAYTPIEISAAALRASERELSAAFPDIEIRAVRADYTRPIAAEDLSLDPPARRRVVYFPGSTISNFEHQDATGFLERMGRIAGPEGGILIGVDLLKPVDRLIRAYDDSEGVTARFNLNLLIRLRSELNAELELDAFAHEARFNEPFRRIEMHLVARRDTAIRLGGKEFRLTAGESIHTENSHKYSAPDFKALAATAGLRSAEVWKDPAKLFSMHWLVPAEG